MGLRYLLLMGLGLAVAACRPSVSGVVYFDPDQDGQRGNGAFGVQNVPIELYRLDTKTTNTSAAANTNNTTNTNTNQNKNTTRTAVGLDSTTTNAFLLGVKAAHDEYGTPVTVDPYGTPAPTTESTTTTTTVAQPKARGRLVATIHTDRRGVFRFNGIEAGDYEVRVSDSYGPLQKGYRLTSGMNPVTVSAQFKGARVEFGLYKTGLTQVTTNCPETMQGGERRLCRAVFRNDAPTSLQQVIVTVTLPQSIDAMPQDGGTYLGGSHQVQWVFPEVVAGQTIAAGFVIIPRQQSAAETEIELTWQLQSASDPEETIVASVNTELETTPEVGVQLATPAHITAGEALPVEITFDNRGDLELTAAELVLTLPESMSVVTAADSQIDLAAHTIRWAIGRLPVGANGARYATLKPSSIAAAASTVTLKAAVHATGLSEGAAATDAVVEILPNVAPKVEITVTPLEVTVDAEGAGDLVTWQVKVTQAGTAALSQVRLVATVDPLLSVKGAGTGTLDSAAHTITWDLGELAPGSTTTVELQAEPSAQLTGMDNALKVSFQLSAKGLSEPITTQADVHAVFQVE